MEVVHLSKTGKLYIVIGIAILVFLFVLNVWSVLVPFIWAALAAYVFDPVITYTARITRLGRIWIVVLFYLVLAGLLAWFLFTVVPIVNREVRDLARELPKMVTAAQQFLEEQEALSIFGATINTQQLVNEIPRLAQEVGRTLFGRAVPAAFIALHFVLSLTLFLMATFYFLVDGRRLLSATGSLTPPALRTEAHALTGQIDLVLQAYLRGLLFLFTLMSALTFVALTLLGVRFALVLAIMTGFLELFPIIGPWTAGTIAVTTVLFQTNVFGWPNYLFAGLIALIYFTLRQLEDYLVIPQVMGHAVRMHPVIVLFAVFSGGVLAGILGFFIAVPVAAILRVLGSYIYAKLTDDTTWLERVLAQQGKGVTKEETAPLKEMAAEANPGAGSSER